jgi:hypothetical protein
MAFRHHAAAPRRWLIRRFGVSGVCPRPGRGNRRIMDETEDHDLMGPELIDSLADIGDGDDVFELDELDELLRSLGHDDDDLLVHDDEYD